jgi:hypothetical protein
VSQEHREKALTTGRNRQPGGREPTLRSARFGSRWVGVTAAVLVAVTGVPVRPCCCSVSYTAPKASPGAHGRHPARDRYPIHRRHIDDNALSRRVSGKAVSPATCRALRPCWPRNERVSETSTGAAHRTMPCGRRSWNRALKGAFTRSYLGEPARTTLPAIPAWSVAQSGVSKVRCHWRNA